MPEETIKIKISANNVLLKKRFQDIISSTKEFCIQQVTEKKPPDLLVQDLSGDYEKDFRFIESLLSSNAVEEVFVTSQYSGSDLLLGAMRSGAKEFLVQPLNEQEVKQALERFKKRRYSKKDVSPNLIKSGRLINVLGSKGGVGTTTVAVNLAVGLAQNIAKESVALIDMNTVFGDIPLFLTLKATHHWGAITNNIDRLDEMFLTNVLSKHASGVQVLPSPSHLNGDRPATPEVIGELIALMQKMFDLIIIDSGQSLNETSLKVLSMSDDIFLVSLLSLPCLSNTNKLLRSFSNLGHARKDQVRIIINRYLKNSQLSLQDAENSIGRNIFWTVPNDYTTTMSAINQGKALSEVSSGAAVTRSFQELSKTLIRGKEKANRKKRFGLFGR
jgi:pilus assembly protein CpaE